MSAFDWTKWYIGGEYGQGFVLGWPDCDCEYTSPYVAGNVGELAAIARKHAEAEHS